ncbi:MAG: GGDEF domain-containing protein [Dehalococcoidia bacterium]|jgi:diguanylate cyclase (GGDEF)-like protein
MIYWMKRSGSIHSMKQPTEEQQTLSGEEPPVSRAARLEEAPGWHRPSLRPLRLHTNRVAPVRETPPELRELERYLILALALVSASLLTGLVERADSQAYLTAMRFPLAFAVCVVCATALVRLRGAKGGLVRTGLPLARDGVTGLPDEQYFWLRLREEYSRSRRYGEAFSVAILDVNSLRMINHTYGEAAGDAALGRVANVVDSAKRGSDVAVRMADDEFAILLLDCDRDGAEAFAERVRQYLDGSPAALVLQGRPLTFPIGVSIGVAAIMEHEPGAEALVGRARHNLTLAKEEREMARSRWAI